MNGYLLSPTSMITGPGCWRAALPHIATLGTRAFVLGGVSGLLAATPIIDALREHLAHIHIETFRGECTDAAIASAATAAADFDLVLGIGGGKAIDTAKAVAIEQDVPCITIPTSPATCAAYTPLSIIHSDRGAYIESRRLSRPVALLIQDPEFMIDAPTRLLSAGCIDALARVWDTLLAARVGIPTSMAALSVAVCEQLWQETVRPLAAQALAAQRFGTVTPVFTSVTEACIIGAGLAGQMGARFFGRSFSHALGYALADVVDNGSVLHGEAVGLGVLVQCALDAETTMSLSAMRTYFDRLNAPAQFIDLGIDDLSGESGRHLATATHRLLDLDAAVPFPVSIDDVHQAMQTVEHLNAH